MIHLDGVPDLDGDASKGGGGDGGWLCGGIPVERVCVEEQGGPYTIHDAPAVYLKWVHKDGSLSTDDFPAGIHVTNRIYRYTGGTIAEHFAAASPKSGGDSGCPADPSSGAVPPEILAFDGRSFEIQAPAPPGEATLRDFFGVNLQTGQLDLRLPTNIRFEEPDGEPWELRLHFNSGIQRASALGRRFHFNFEDCPVVEALIPLEAVGSGTRACEGIATDPWRLLRVVNDSPVILRNRGGRGRGGGRGGGRGPRIEQGGQAGGGGRPAAGGAFVGAAGGAHGRGGSAARSSGAGGSAGGESHVHELLPRGGTRLDSGRSRPDRGDGAGRQGGGPALRYREDEGGFVRPGALLPGDRLLWVSGPVPVAAIERLSCEETVFNLEVAGLHTCGVARQGLLVHHTCSETAGGGEKPNARKTTGEIGERKGLGCNAFKGKTPAEIDRMLRSKGCVLKGEDPLNGRGTYVNRRTGHWIHIDATYRPPKPLHVRA